MRRKVRNYIRLFLLLLIIANIVMVAINKSQAQTQEVEVVNLNNNNLEISYIDVGQADSALIRVNDKYVLIDAGSRESSNKLVDFLHSKGVTKFEYVVATHPHEDHIGGMKKIIDNFEIANFYMADVITTTKTFEDMLDAMADKKITFKTLNLLDSFNVDEANFVCLSSLSNNIINLNDASIVLKMDYLKTKYLFMADATDNVERNMLDYDLKSDVLKVAHHGSKYSTSAAFLSLVKPKYAIISVGKDNVYKLPSDQVLNRLYGSNIKVYRTDFDGTITVTSDGENIKITKEVN
ncbi:MAG: MBL fold metallo-hydrolase [Bacilli bacterium]|nr:MBL fold metallo-hydrolase [Bacilli bacterium]